MDLVELKVFCKEEEEKVFILVSNGPGGVESTVTSPPYDNVRL